jgi:hypothetical protein
MGRLTRQALEATYENYYGGQTSVIAACVVKLDIVQLR